MAISTLTELKSKSLTYYKDRTDLSTDIQDGVDAATDYFSQKLRVREMMTRATLVPDADGYVTLPDNFIELITVTEDISFGRPLNLLTPAGIGNTYYAGTAGIAYNYEFFGSTLRLYPTSANDVIITYFAAIPHLVDNTAETNWLLLKFPTAYLDYCRMFAADIADDQPAEARFAGKVDTFIDLLNERHQTSMYSNMTTDLSSEMIVP